MTDIVIIGAGGFGREVAWTLARINAQAPAPVWNFCGFVDDNPELHLMTTAQLEARTMPPALFVAIGNNTTREKLMARFAACTFPAFVDPSADVAPDAQLGPGVYVGPQAVVSVAAQLDRGVIVNAHANVGHDCILGPFAQVCPGAALSGACRLGARAFIGTNASLVPGISIGDDAQVAAGLPVYSSLVPNATLSPFGIFARK